jgi:hypothetical protein
MKYAVAFHGLPRIANRDSVQKWQEIISAYQADVFIHSWCDKPDMPDTQKALIETFNPVKIHLEPSRDFGINNDDYPRRVFPTVVPYNVFSAHASFKESMRLLNEYSKVTSKIYDFVIKGRFDVIPGHLEFDYPNCITVPVDPLLMMKKQVWRTYKEVYAINDLIAIGPQHLMELYANSIDFLDYFYTVDGLDMCSELMIGANLARQHVPVVQRLGIPVIVR